MARSRQGCGESELDLVEIIVRSCQNYGKILQNHGKILLKSWQEPVEIMARSRQIYGNIVQNYGKILFKSLLKSRQELAKIV